MRPPSGLLVMPGPNDTFPEWLTATMTAMSKLTSKQRKAEALRDAYIEYQTDMNSKLTPEAVIVRVGYRDDHGFRREIVFRHRELET